MATCVCDTYKDFLTKSTSRVDPKACPRGIDASLYNLKTRSENVIDVKDGSDGRGNKSSSMYMLVSLNNDAGVVLYRIDPQHHLQFDCSYDLNDLRPLLVFPTDCEIEYFNCVKFGSKLYFFGLDHYMDRFGICEDSINVYTIEEEVLVGIKPSEDNDVNNFKEFFTKVKNPMNGPKYVPLLFVANQKLYVLSKYYTDTLFEVFSPVDETWQVLSTPYDKPFGRGASLFLEQNQTFYYFSGRTLLSFNLETHEWTAPPDYIVHKPFATFDDDSYIYPRPPSAFFEKCVSVIGDLAFGYVYDDDAESYYISASRTFPRAEELTRPYLAPDQAFLEVLRSSRFTYMSGHNKLYSDYIVALQDFDGKEVLCVVTYGIKLPNQDGLNVCTKTSYVALSFFDIPGDFYTSKDRPVQEYDVHAFYADMKTKDGGVVRRYFNAKFRHTTHFIINTSHLCTHGQLKACFFG